MVRNIEKLEQKYENRNTILVGDFNANPFDGCMTKATKILNLKTQ